MIPLNHSKIFLKLEIQVYIKVSCNFTPVGGGGRLYFHLQELRDYKAVSILSGEVGEGVLYIFVCNIIALTVNQKQTNF